MCDCCCRLNKSDGGGEKIFYRQRACLRGGGVLSNHTATQGPPRCVPAYTRNRGANLEKACVRVLVGCVCVCLCVNIL